MNSLARRAMPEYFDRQDAEAERLQHVQEIHNQSRINDQIAEGIVENATYNRQTPYQEAEAKQTNRLQKAQNDLKWKLGTNQQSNYNFNQQMQANTANIQSKIGTVGGSHEGIKNKIGGLTAKSNFKKKFSINRRGNIDKYIKGNGAGLKSIRQYIGIKSKHRSKAYKDFDGDGVMNLLDCEPKNKKKQGRFHDWVTRHIRGTRQQSVPQQRMDAIDPQVVEAEVVSPKAAPVITKIIPRQTKMQRFGAGVQTFGKGVATTGKTLVKGTQGFASAMKPLGQMGARGIQTALGPPSGAGFQRMIGTPYGAQRRVKQPIMQAGKGQNNFYGPNYINMGNGVQQKKPQQLQQGIRRPIRGNSRPKPFLYYDQKEVEKLKKLTGVRSGSTGKDKLLQRFGNQLAVDSPMSKLKARGFI